MQRVGADGTVYTELRDQAGGPRPVTVQLSRGIDTNYIDIDHTRKAGSVNELQHLGVICEIIDH